MGGNSHRWVVVAALVAAGMSVGAPAQTTGRTVRHHKVAVEESSVAPAVVQAEAALDKKDYPTAERLLTDTVGKDPNDYRAWFDLGFLYNATERASDAITAYRKSVAAKPDVFESNLNLGILLARAGNRDAATFLRAATTLKPTAKPQEGWYRAWDSLGHVLAESKPQEAVAAFQKAAELQPASADPHLSAAMVMEAQNDLAGAEKEFQRAMELDPNSNEAIAGLANVYMKQKRLPEAEAMLRKYLAADPQNAKVHVQLGRVLAAEKKNDEAVAELQEGLKDAPDDPTALRELAGLNALAKNYKEAAAQYRELLAKSPRDGELHYALGSVLKEQHDFPGAQKELIAAITLKPDMADAYGDLAVVANENQNYALALKALDARAKFQPETPATYFMRATIFDRGQSYDRATDYYCQFLGAVSGDQFPDQQWQARHRLLAINKKATKKDPCARK